MAEYGHVLPEPGDEQMWLDGLPAEDRADMQGVGKWLRVRRYRVHRIPSGVPDDCEPPLCNALQLVNVRCLMNQNNT